MVLSRVQSFEGLHLTSFLPAAVITNNHICSMSNKAAETCKLNPLSHSEETKKYDTIPDLPTSDPEILYDPNTNNGHVASSHPSHSTFQSDIHTNATVETVCAPSKSVAKKLTSFICSNLDTLQKNYQL